MPHPVQRVHRNTGTFPVYPLAPTQIPGCIWSIEASKGISLTSSGSVSSWADQSSTQVNAIQATAIAQPVFNATGLNGKSCVIFDGVHQFMTANGVATLLSGNKNPFTINWVGAWISPAGSSYQLSFDDINSNNGLNFQLTGSSNLINLGRVDDNAVGQAYTWRVQGLWTIPAMYSWTFDGVNSHLFVNGWDKVSGTYTNGQLTLAHLTIGSSQVGGVIAHPSNIKFGAISMFNRSVTLSELRSIIIYYNATYSLFARYGLP